MKEMKEMKKIDTDMEVEYSAVVDLLILRGIYFLAAKEIDREDVAECEEFVSDFNEKEYEKKKITLYLIQKKYIIDRVIK